MIRKNFFFFLLLFGLLSVSCGDDSEPAVSLSQDNFANISYEENTLKVSIQTSLEWTATSLVNWCRVSQSKGTGDAVLELSLEPNIDTERSGVVKIWTKEQIREINIRQEGIPDGQEFTYRLPVIFHVLYSDAEDRNQYIDQGRLLKVLDRVNTYYDGITRYNGGDKGVDMNLEFVPAETDETGNALLTPGVEYVKMDAMPLDCEAFMGDSRYVKLLWDPNRYINVMLYNFAEVDGGGSVILGISHLPLSTTGTTYLEGLPATQYAYLTKENLSYPKCLSINSLYVYEETGSDGKYNGFDVNVTLAHELGHYLGLHHAFDEDENSGLSTDCIDSDYCEDTPSYNRIAYMMNLRALLQETAQQGTSLSMAEAVKRENCKTGQIFSSYNLMDYEISYADRLTNDQRNRIRHVLTYSPLTPGPKKGKANTRSVIEGKLYLPMVIVK